MAKIKGFGLFLIQKKFLDNIEFHIIVFPEKEVHHEFSCIE